MRATKLVTRKHNDGKEMKAAAPERRAGKNTRRKVLNSNAKRARRAGIRSELIVDWSAVGALDDVLQLSARWLIELPTSRIL